jgi:hypothetical protein
MLLRIVVKILETRRMGIDEYQDATEVTTMDIEVPEEYKELLSRPNVLPMAVVKVPDGEK